MKHKVSALILAGGKGNRLGVLSETKAKPFIPFGSKYKIIDFTLYNLKNSNIDNVNVFLQYKAKLLNKYLVENKWGINNLNTYIGGLGLDDKYYSGTADAIYDNIINIDKSNPEYVIVLNADHIYEMDYEKVIEFHIRKKSDLTISYINVSARDTYRYGILKSDMTGKVLDYEEKPMYTDSTKASMGLYVIKWSLLRKYLISDALDKNSKHDLGHNIIPKILKDGYDVYSYEFKGYWEDVGTIYSYWKSNLDMLKEENYYLLRLNNDYKISVQNNNVIAPKNTCIKGTVCSCVVHDGVVIGSSSYLNKVVVHPNVNIGNNVKISYAIISEGVVIPDDIEIHGLEEDIVIITTDYIESILDKGGMCYG